MNCDSTRAVRAFHGGRFFDQIGTGFEALGRAKEIISADVLDAWFPPSPRVLEKLQDYLSFLLRTSPPAYGDGLIRTISKSRGVPAENLCVGGGSSQLIFASLAELTTGSRRVLILDPMYGEYAHVLEQVLDRDVHRHYLTEESAFRIDTASLVQQTQQLRPELVIIVNPNSPTGQYWPRSELISFLSHLTNTICLVDETYVEYVNAMESVETLVSEYPNLVVIKSMSKVYALSGVRVAYMAAAEPIIRRVMGRLPPWAVSLPAQVAAVEALQDPDYYQARYQETHDFRNNSLNLLSSIERIRLFSTCANFYLLKTSGLSAQAIVSQLESQNIYVRHCDSMSTQFQDNFIRIAVKDAMQNKRIAQALMQFLSGSKVASVDAFRVSPV